MTSIRTVLPTTIFPPETFDSGFLARWSTVAKMALATHPNADQRPMLAQVAKAKTPQAAQTAIKNLFFPNTLKPLDPRGIAGALVIPLEKTQLAHTGKSGPNKGLGNAVHYLYPFMLENDRIRQALQNIAADSDNITSGAQKVAAGRCLSLLAQETAVAAAEEGIFGLAVAKAKESAETLRKAHSSLRDETIIDQTGFLGLGKQIKIRGSQNFMTESLAEQYMALGSQEIDGQTCIEHEYLLYLESAATLLATIGDQGEAAVDALIDGAKHLTDAPIEVQLILYRALGKHLKNPKVKQFFQGSFVGMAARGDLPLNSIGLDQLTRALASQPTLDDEELLSLIAGLSVRERVAYHDSSTPVCLIAAMGMIQLDPFSESAIAGIARSIRWYACPEKWADKCPQALADILRNPSFTELAKMGKNTAATIVALLDKLGDTMVPREKIIAWVFALHAAPNLSNGPTLLANAVIEEAKEHPDEIQGVINAIINALPDDTSFVFLQNILALSKDRHVKSIARTCLIGYVPAAAVPPLF